MSLRMTTGRRQLIQSLPVIAASGVLSAPAIAQTKTLRIGFIAPLTGPYAALTTTHTYVVGAVRAALTKSLTIHGKQYPLEIIVRDNQSSSNRSSEVAADLVLSDGVDIVVASISNDTINPVADQCELNGVPCVTTVAPWQTWLFGRGGTMQTRYEWTYHFFFGVSEFVGVFLDMWDQVPSNRRIGLLLPNDSMGQGAADPKVGFPPTMIQRGYTVVDEGRYENLSNDFSGFINAFKQRQVEIVCGIAIPPDWTNFWIQAVQQGYRAKAATSGAAMVIPSVPEALGKIANNMSCDVFWTPRFPFRSSLDGQTCQQFADSYTAQSGRQWTQLMGPMHALLEVAVAALRTADDPKDKAAVSSALARMRLDTMVGPLDWTKGPHPNVALTPLCGGQWRQVTDGRFPFDLVVTTNRYAPAVPLGDQMRALTF